MLLDYIKCLRKTETNANFIYINFTDLKFDKLKEYHLLNDYVLKKYKAGKQNYLFIDEVQLCPQFGNYYNLDGVSGLIYNVAYLFSIPRKILTYWRCADGLMGYLWGVVLVVLGGLLSIIGCVIAPIVNTICHPIETLSNLTIGVFYLDHYQK